MTRILKRNSGQRKIREGNRSRKWMSAYVIGKNKSKKKVIERKQNKTKQKE